MWGSGGPFQSLQFGGSVHTDVSVCVPLLLHGAPCGSEQGGWGGSSASLGSIPKGFPQGETPDTHQAWPGVRLPLIAALGMPPFHCQHWH